jgi:hypothetical protein
VAYTRGLPVGEYTINLHLYRIRDGGRPVPVMVEVGLKKSLDAPVRKILVRKVSLTQVGEELTVVRFNMESTGALIPGTVNNLPRPLRSAGN